MNFLYNLVRNNMTKNGFNANHALVQSIGYVGIPSLDVLSVVFGAHKNGAALPYTK